MSTGPKPLRIWLVCIGEYLPTDPGHERQLRMSLLAQTLHERGHDVTWWASTYDHEAKRLRYDTDTELRYQPRYAIQLLHGRPYRRNVSLDRLRNHAEIARAFTRLAGRREPPDLIVATIPTVELGAASADYARQHGVPLVIDIRDQHPDIYLSLVPAPLRPLARLGLTPMYRDLDRALAGASAVTASSQSFLDWGLRHAGRAGRSSDAAYPLAYPELAIDSALVAEAGRELRALGVDPARKLLWYVGTFNRWIDLGTPIRAAQQMAAQGLGDVQLVLSGDGDHAAQWRSMARGATNVVFTGWIRQPAIAWLREAAWAGLAPYRSGFTTLGNKLFEFMAGGLPILFSLEKEPRALLEELGVGLYYRPGDPASLADAIRRLADEQGLRDRLSAGGRAAYRQHFRADVVYANMAGHLERVAANPAPPPTRPA